VGLSVVPSPRVVAGMVRCDRFAVNEINQTERPRRPGMSPGPGVMTSTICVHREVAGRSRCSGGQAADVVIAQAVEHQHDQLAGGGDHADVAAPALADPVPGLA
jgi:hypothetical protein